MTEVVKYRPEPDELSYTFGGRQAVRRVAPGTVLELYTDADKRYLGAAPAYDGVHARLRAGAQDVPEHPLIGRRRIRDSNS